MKDAFDAVDFVLYVRRRWRVIAICCASALLLTGAAGEILQPRYTASATLLIQPPASSDPRAALAVSPVYLESLKTYETLATSDTLFARALTELNLRGKYPNSSVESLKRRVLTVSKPAATRILQIDATLNDPLAAKRLAQFIAEQTVALNRSLDQHSADDAIREATRNLVAAETRLVDAARASTAGTGPQTVEALSSDLKSTSDLKYQVQWDLARSRTELADLISQHNSFPAGDEKAEWNARETAATSARIQALEGEERKLMATVTEKATLLEHARPGRDLLDAEQRLARADLETARTKLTELRASGAFRGERLEVLDPGIVPERPSYPNVPLILLVSLLVSVAASIGYLAIAFGYSRALSHRVISAHAEQVYQLR